MEKTQNNTILQTNAVIPEAGGCLKLLRLEPGSQQGSSAPQGGSCEELRQRLNCPPYDSLHVPLIRSHLSINSSL